MRVPTLFRLAPSRLPTKSGAFNCQHLPPHLIQHTPPQQPDQVCGTVNGLEIGARYYEDRLATGHRRSQMKKPCRALQRIARYSFEGEEHTAAAALVSKQGSKRPQLASGHRARPGFAFHDQRTIQKVKAVPCSIVPEIEINFLGLIGAPTSWASSVIPRTLHKTRARSASSRCPFALDSRVPCIALSSARIELLNVVGTRASSRICRLPTAGEDFLGQGTALDGVEQLFNGKGQNSRRIVEPRQFR